MYITEKDLFVCKKNVYINGALAYKEGKPYISEIDNCITDEQGIRLHFWMENRESFFSKLEDKKEEKFYIMSEEEKEKRRIFYEHQKFIGEQQKREREYEKRDEIARWEFEHHY